MAQDQPSLYMESIVQVEQRVREHLLSSMPCIKTLASEFNMSSSTLQRHFKIVYGKNIYQYYLEQKPLLGKELIDSRKKWYLKQCICWDIIKSIVVQKYLKNILAYYLKILTPQKGYKTSTMGQKK